MSGLALTSTSPATRYYNAENKLTRRLNHEQWAPAWWSNPLAGNTMTYTQSDTVTTVLAVPGDFASATETVVGESILRDPRTGDKVLMSQVVTGDGLVEFRSGKQPFLDAFVNGDLSLSNDVCGGPGRLGDTALRRDVGAGSFADDQGAGVDTDPLRSTGGTCVQHLLGMSTRIGPTAMA